MITCQAKRLKQYAVEAGIPRKFVRVRTELKRRYHSAGDNYSAGYTTEYGDALGSINHVYDKDELNKYASLLEQNPKMVVTRYHADDGRLICVYFEEAPYKKELFA
jgi:hypothetical protein